MRTKKIIDIDKLWMEEFLAKDERGFTHCGLCGNYGVIDTSSMNLKTPAGYKVTAIKTYCICPNGRTMRKKKIKI